MHWFVKAGVQSVLSRIWGGEWINHQLQRARGSMGSVSYLGGRIEYGVSFLKRNHDLIRPEGKRVVEIGTGWDAIHTVLLSALGAEEITTIDHIAHLRLEPTLQVVEQWKERSRLLAELTGQSESKIAARLDAMLGCRTLSELLTRMRTNYVAPGDICRTALPDGSIDMVYGYAVMAHLPRPVIHGFCRETGRILRKGGLCIQRIGLEDPFNDWKGGDCVDFLRFSPTMWRILGENSMTYHNRFRAIEYRRAFEAAGGSVVRSTETLDPAMLARVKSMKVAECFRQFTPEELAVTELDLICRFG